MTPKYPNQAPVISDFEGKNAIRISIAALGIWH